MAKKILHTKALVLKENIGEDGVIDAVVGSTAVIDRMGDSISQDGWALKNFKANPVILWGHNMGATRPPIGKALKVWIEDKGSKSAKLMFKVKFDLLDTFAAEIFRKIKDNFLNTVSVGFMPTEWESLDGAEDNNPWAPKRYLKQELLELSFVPVPANPEAVVALRAMKDKRFTPVELKEIYPQIKKKKIKKKVKKKKEKVSTKVKPKIEIKEKEDKKTYSCECIDCGHKTKTSKHCRDIKCSECGGKMRRVDRPGTGKTVKNKVKKKLISKKVIPFKDLGFLPESETWDGPGERAKAKTEDLKLICAWYDADKAESKDSYKLPHHKAEGHKAVWRGITAAMASLLGARGGVDIPEEDRKSVYRHLKKHYKQFDKTAPSFKMVQNQVLGKLEDEVHSLVLDREDKHMVRLIKKVIDRLKQAKKAPVVATYTSTITDEQTTLALKVINLALSSYKKDSNNKGGE